MVQKILRSGDPKLRGISKPISRLDNKVLKLIQDLKDTLASQKEPEGVGLAAPQIGKNIRIFVASYKNFFRVVINPEIVKIHRTSDIRHKQSLALRAQPSTMKREVLEGCLSLPNYYGPLKRAGYVKLKYLNENGREVVETIRGFPAQIILHEIDHLNGILFIDHLLKQKKNLYQLIDGEWEEVEL